ncbi:MAG: T9SS C-terminal target domain-containing protein [Cytophagia bacterium]|nr:T9SS C-terminal target domain-containing protein [Cytophagia bacterium]
MKFFKTHLLVALALSANFLFAQTVESSTFASGGATTVINGKYYSHVIGQSSVVAGTAIKSGVTMRQGFKQPNLLARTIQKSGLKIQVSEENPMTYTVFPNPFSDKIKIQFSEVSKSPTFIAIYNISGQSIWEKMYPEKIDEVNLTDFENVRIGKYILHIVYKGKPFIASIVKE